MSDLLTHWALFEDCRRLAQHDKKMDPFFTKILDEEREFARLGAITRGGSRWIPDILTKAREQFSSETETEKIGRRVAFALGGITHYAADHMMKPLMSKHGQTDWNAAHDNTQKNTSEMPSTIQEVSAYYDVHVFREVYLSGQEEPFSRFLTAENESSPGQALEDFVRALFQRSLLASHTLNPDKENFEAWLDELFAKVQPLYVNLKLYSQVFSQPDPGKMKGYAVETEFYRKDDPAIKVARAVQRGENITNEVLDEALAEGANKSGYGAAIDLSMRALREASAYWRGEGEMPNVRQ